MLVVLASAVIAGVSIGLASRLVPSWRSAPTWLPVVIGVMAALAGSLAVRAAGVEPAGSEPRIVMQLFFAAVGVLTMGATGAPRLPRARPTSAEGHEQRTGLR